MFDAIKESRITNKRKPLNKNHNSHTHTEGEHKFKEGH